MTKFNSNLQNNFFEYINNEEKAYWLGFLIADGYIEVSTPNSSRLGITLNQKDEQHLYKFKQAIQADNIVSTRKYQDKRCKSPIFRAQFRVSNRQLIKDLAKYSIVPNKTGKESLPEIDHSLKKHLIRGYIDGDGWIRKQYKTMGFVASNMQVVNYIQNYLNKEIGVMFKIIDETEKYNTGVINCNLNKREDSHRALKHLYENASVYLDRKKVLVDEIN